MSLSPTHVLPGSWVGAIRALCTRTKGTLVLSLPLLLPLPLPAVGNAIKNSGRPAVDRFSVQSALLLFEQGLIYTL